MENTLKKIQINSKYTKIYNPYKEQIVRHKFLWWGYLGKSYDNVL